MLMLDNAIEEFYQGLEAMYATHDPEKIEGYLRQSANVGCCTCRGQKKPLQVIMFNELGTFYRVRGMAEAAIEAYEKAEQLSMQIHGENSPETATVRVNLASAYRIGGQWKEAMEEFEKAKGIYAATVGAHGYHYATVLNNIGLLQIDRQQYPEAIHRFTEAAAILEELGTYPAELATTYTNIATAALQEEDLEQAERYARKGIGLYGQLPKEERGHFAAANNTLANVEFYRGNWRKALELFEIAREYTVFFFGKNVEYATASSSMAECWRRLHNQSRAERCLREGMEALEQLGLQNTKDYAMLQKAVQS